MSYRIALLGLALACTWGCTPSHPPEVRETDTFVDLQAPTTSRRGEPVRVVLKVIGSNGCWQGVGATATVDEVAKSVTFRGTRQRPGQPMFGAGFGCTGAITFLPVQATFVPTGTGTYNLQARIAPSYSSDGTSAAVLEKLGMPAKNPQPGKSQDVRDLAWPLTVTD